MPPRTLSIVRVASLSRHEVEQRESLEPRDRESPATDQDVERFSDLFNKSDYAAPAAEKDETSELEKLEELTAQMESTIESVAEVSALLISPGSQGGQGAQETG